MKKILAIFTALGLMAAASAQAPANTYVSQTFAAIDTLDPVLAYDSASGTVLENVYETLYGYEGESITDYEPRLATSYEISEDGLSYTYTLREGVRFHSGNEMTCRDVEYSIQRGLVTNPSDSGMWFMAESFLGTGDNANEALGEDASDEDYAAYWARIDNAVECLDDYTVRFNLHAVDPAFFGKMLFYGNSIVDSQWAIDNAMWDGTEATWREWIGVDLRQHYLHNNASGTGAYRLVSWDGETAIAERFDDYWGEGGAIENVVIQRVEEQSARILALQQGDADRIELADRASLEQVRGDPNVTIHEDPEWLSVVVGAIFMNQNITVENNPDAGSGQLDGGGVPPDFFTDRDMRLCIAYTFDHDTFIEQVYQGEGQLLTMALPPSYLGYNPDIPLYTEDLERAEEHCRAAHGGQVWERGFEFTIAYNTGNVARQTIAEIIKDNLEFLNPNFRVNVRSIAWPEFLAARQEGTLPISLVAWIPDYADPDNYIHTFYHSQGYYGVQAGFADEEIDRLIDEARATTDPQEREALYFRVGERAHELVPFVVYPSATVFIPTRATIEGVYRNPMLSGQYLWKDIAKN
jgi:peptide/nickel transport system substrate-binding protein